MLGCVLVELLIPLSRTHIQNTNLHIFSLWISQVTTPYLLQFFCHLKVSVEFSVFSLVVFTWLLYLTAKRNHSFSTFWSVCCDSEQGMFICPHCFLTPWVSFLTLRVAVCVLRQPPPARRGPAEAASSAATKERRNVWSQSKSRHHFPPIIPIITTP